MPGRRRSPDEFPTPTLTEIENLYLKKALETNYVRMPHLAMRDAALIAFEFLFKCRVSEVLGRTYPYDKAAQENAEFVDTYDGVRVEDFQIAKVKRRKVLRVRFRILKRGRKKKLCGHCETSNRHSARFCYSCGKELTAALMDYRLPEIFEWSSIQLDHPFVKYILRWLKYRIEHGAKDKDKIFNICRVRAHQIMKNLGINNHLLRHWRATQLADTMDPFELQAALHRATIPSEYVHRAESRQLTKSRKADKIWE